jgi:hypothetical protein
MLERKTLTPVAEWAQYWPAARNHVLNGRVSWSPTLPGFRWSDGAAFGNRSDSDFHLLIVLWKAKGQNLICVEGTRVVVTDKGARS